MDVLDARGIGAGASGASAGLLHPFSPKVRFHRKEAPPARSNRCPGREVAKTYLLSCPMHLPRASSSGRAWRGTVPRWTWWRRRNGPCRPRGLRRRTWRPQRDRAAKAPRSPWSVARASSAPPGRPGRPWTSGASSGAPPAHRFQLPTCARVPMSHVGMHTPSGWFISMRDGSHALPQEEPREAGGGATRCPAAVGNRGDRRIGAGTWARVRRTAAHMPKRQQRAQWSLWLQVPAPGRRVVCDACA